MIVYIIVAMESLGEKDEDVREYVEENVDHLDGFKGTAIFPQVRGG